MKRFFILCAIILGFSAQKSFAHKEWVHQYILQEAYRYLSIKLGKPIPVLWRQIKEPSNMSDDNVKWRFGRPAEYAPAATIGIFREDNFDAGAVL